MDEYIYREGPIDFMKKRFVQGVFLAPIIFFAGVFIITVFFLSLAYFNQGSLSVPNLLIVLIAGVVLGAFVAILTIPGLLLALIVMYVSYYFPRRGEYLKISEQGIDLSTRYFGPFNSPADLKTSKLFVKSDTELIIPWKDIERIEFYKQSQFVIPGRGMPHIYYFLIKCKNNKSYAKSTFEERIIKKIQKTIEQLGKSQLVDEEEHPLDF